MKGLSVNREELKRMIDIIPEQDALEVYDFIEFLNRKRKEESMQQLDFENLANDENLIRQIEHSWEDEINIKRMTELLNIKRIFKEDYPNGKKIIYEYTSDKYYDVLYKEDENGWTIDLSIKYFDPPFHKYLEGNLFEDYIEGIECYIAELNGEEVGVVSFSHEKWNNVLRINDIHTYQSAQNKGIGSEFMALLKERAAKIGVRAIVLETQTSNYPVIQFYKKHGFNLIGCNLFSYSNNDVEKKEVRIEMGLVLENERNK